MTKNIPYFKVKFSFFWYFFAIFVKIDLYYMKKTMFIVLNLILALILGIFYYLYNNEYSNDKVLNTKTEKEINLTFTL